MGQSKQVELEPDLRILRKAAFFSVVGMQTALFPAAVRGVKEDIFGVMERFEEVFVCRWYVYDVYYLYML